MLLQGDFIHYFIQIGYLYPATVGFVKTKIHRVNELYVRIWLHPVAMCRVQLSFLA